MTPLPFECDGRTTVHAILAAVRGAVVLSARAPFRGHPDVRAGLGEPVGGLRRPPHGPRRSGCGPASGGRSGLPHRPRPGLLVRPRRLAFPRSLRASPRPGRHSSSSTSIRTRPRSSTTRTEPRGGTRTSAPTRRPPWPSSTPARPSSSSSRSLRRRKIAGATHASPLLQSHRFPAAQAPRASLPLPRRPAYDRAVHRFDRETAPCSVTPVGSNSAPTRPRRSPRTTRPSGATSSSVSTRSITARRCSRPIPSAPCPHCLRGILLTGLQSDFLAGKIGEAVAAGRGAGRARPRRASG